MGEVSAAGFDRFAVAPVIAELNRVFGAGLELVEQAEHGDSGGAAFVRWPDGRPGVLTRPPATIGHMRLTAEVLSQIRAVDLPVPRHELVVELSDGGVAVVQERLPGTPAQRVTVSVIDAMIAMNERFSDLLASRADVPEPCLWLQHSAPDHPRHELLEHYSNRTRRLLQQIRDIGRDTTPPANTTDVVHTDYARGNVLFDPAGQVSGVVDWNQGIARGDRRFALVGLRSDLEWSVLNPVENPVDTEAIELLDQKLELDVPAALLRRYWAYWTLEKLHWSILDNAHETAELFLRLGEQRLDLA